MKKNSGFVMVQLAIGIVVVSMVTAYWGRVYMQRASVQAGDDRAKLIGNRLAMISNANKTYATQFNPQIQTNSAATFNGYTVPAARIRSPTLTDLFQLGFLRSEAVNALQYGSQTISFTTGYTVTPAGCVAPACTVSYTVVTTAPLLDGASVDVRRATLAANTASPGNAGVSLPASVGGNPAIFVAKDGNQIATNSGSVAGLIAMIDGYDSQALDVFYRRDGSKPLTADFQAGGFSLKNVNAGEFTGNISTTSGNISSTSGNITTTSGSIKGQTIVPRLLVTENSSCAGYEPGAHATKNDGSGTPEVCLSGVWTKASGGSTGTGLTGMYAPLEGKYISCTASYPPISWIVAEGKVQGKIPYLRVYGYAWGMLRDSGWQSALTVSMELPSSGSEMRGLASFNSLGITGSLNVTSTSCGYDYDCSTSTAAFPCSARWPDV